jgi:hypothetical protein
MVNRYDQAWSLADKLRIGFDSEAWQAALTEHAHEPQEESHYWISTDEAEEALADNQALLLKARQSKDRSEVPALLLRNRGLRQLFKLAEAEGGGVNLSILW